ncbi:hypothetical protein [Ottowia thiooxydans]|uniref:hypothetical protein n=1 Tax=Ottowia thiooxydans TaxID=219182 RepID=UPI0004216C63|nr:hypothetical protein [Ottowia thiooxydans]
MNISALSRSLFILVSAAGLLMAGHAWAANGTDPARFRLTPALLERMNAVEAELKQSGAANKQNDDNDDADAESVQDIARKLDAQPHIRAALARQKLSSTEYVSAGLAALHAGMYLAVEKSADPRAAASLTPEQRANIEVMRARRKK